MGGELFCIETGWAMMCGRGWSRRPERLRRQSSCVRRATRARDNRRKEPLHAAAIAAGRSAVSFAEQHAGHFAAAVENRTARISLASRGRSSTISNGNCGAGRDVLRATAAGRRYLPEP